MKAITLRGIPEPIARRIEEHARRRNISLNRAVIDLLGEQMPRKAQRVYHDLDHLAGTWSADEADEFDRSLHDMRSIEPEMWR